MLDARRIVITGANGNLGHKLTSAFESASWCRSILAIDQSFHEHGTADTSKMVAVQADLANHQDERWIEAIKDADVIVHLAAQNPYPTASWEDAVASFDMTLNLLGAAGKAGVSRFVFISSNHVMGGYKDAVPAIPPGGLTEALPPRPGTRTRDVEGRVNDLPAYAVHKLMGERLCRERALASAGRLTTVSLRVGWCQPGENLPSTLNATGVPGEEVAMDDADQLRDQSWFRGMWLSNADLVRIVERAILADASTWPEPAIVINAMSANQDMVWSLDEARRCLDYVPQDRS
jgi:nucleoside-diphosphate-sugar epimerase